MHGAVSHNFLINENKNSFHQKKLYLGVLIWFCTHNNKDASKVNTTHWCQIWTKKLGLNIIRWWNDVTLAVLSALRHEDEIIHHFWCDCLIWHYRITLGFKLSQHILTTYHICPLSWWVWVIEVQFIQYASRWENIRGVQHSSHTWSRGIQVFSKYLFM